MKFIVDHNAGKLVKWLRMMGYDTSFFTGKDDWQMVMTALSEGRIILTRDTEVMRRGAIASGRLQAILIQSDNPGQQIRQVVETLNLDTKTGLFTICLEDNGPLREIQKEQVIDRVPPHVYETQDKYVECPKCRRVYWRGTHWTAMVEKLAWLG